MFAYLTPILVILIASLVYGVSALRKNNKLPSVLLKTLLLNVALFTIASVWWFYFETDGFSQVIGVGIYSASLLVVSLIDSVVLLLVKRSLRV